MNVFIASDHAGFDLKNQIILNLKNQTENRTDKQAINIFDLGPFNTESVDYSDYANLVCLKMNDPKKSSLTDFGILICGSGQGMALRANKFLNIRAALVYNDEIAKLSREHNNANIICLGSRFCSVENANKWINIFTNTDFSEGRHRQRVDKISQST